ncbi:hypothetical protein OsJ_04800 [Oryza sativa Japonica Group]|uniref:Peptidase A1 domain-containing protein n=1 Tax=Oryza sativa subsp. japonica TaxID=39947 RepID=B9EWI1_ORYSJ|nr:hypothetical protein OsJ_04800 [Oryza sativa Japonica Group]
MSLLALPLLAFLSIFLTPTTAVSSSTLQLARSHSVTPNAGAPLSAWAASVAAQSAADTARIVSMLTSGAGPLTTRAKPKPKNRANPPVPIAPGRQILSIPNYIARAGLGTPAQTLLVAIDPSNDAAWVPCSACAGCAASSPSFSPTQSSTYRTVPCGSPQCAQVPSPSCPAGVGSSCGFNLTYAASTFQAVLGQDSLALENNVVVSYTFGCLRVVNGNSRAAAGAHRLRPRAALLLVADQGHLGPIGQPKRIKTTPLLYNPHRPSLYYVNMIGIRVGSKVVQVPQSALAFNPVTGSGTIIDAGTMFTRLAAPVYAAVRDAFRGRVRTPVAPPLGGFDTCYNVTVSVPTVTFMFAGAVAVTLPEENVMIHSSSGGVACLAMAAGPSDGVNAALNVLASMQQQNQRVLFDVANGRVGFSRELCTA